MLYLNSFGINLFDSDNLANSKFLSNVTTTMSCSFLNPFTAEDVIIDFTLSNARRFYSSKENPLAVKGLKKVVKLNRS